MDGIGYNLNDAISNLVKRSKEDDHTPFYKKKWFIGVSIGVSILIVGIIVLIVVLLTNREKKALGEIHCIYEINDVTQRVQILSEDFDKGQNDFDIVINEETIRFTKDYKFPNSGKNNVLFKIYKEINMDNMFKDVKALISVILNSTEQISIISMESTFENCEKLKSFSIKDYKVDGLKSFRRSFYNTALNNTNMAYFSSCKIEDFSYMFGSYKYEYLDLKNIKTQYAKNMSHMFYNSKALVTLDLTNIQMLKICQQCLKDVILHISQIFQNLKQIMLLICHICLILIYIQIDLI